MKNLILLLSILAIFTMATTTLAQTNVPMYINYQGFLEDSTGNPVTAPALLAKFKIFDDSTGGVLHWEDQYEVDVQEGLFSLILGPIPDSVFMGTGDLRYLEVVPYVFPTGFIPLEPRQQIVSAPYAIRAAVADSVINGGDGVQSVTASPPLEDTGTSEYPHLILNFGGGLYLENDTLKALVGVNDHGDLTGLEDDDHQQYLLVNGTRPMNNVLNMGQYDIIEVEDIIPQTGYPNIGSTTIPFGNLFANHVKLFNNGVVRAYNEGEHISIWDVWDIQPEQDANADIGDSGQRFDNIWCVQLHQGDLVEHIKIVNPVREFDVVVWQDGELRASAIPEDKRVFGVATFTEDYIKVEGEKQYLGTGKYYPVIQGIFQVRVTGHIEEGDLLVTSSVPGSAMASENPKPGTVIAQALESSSSGTKVIKAMIRKF